jgi:hypothetical protein
VYGEKSKPREIQHKRVNEKNNIWRIIPGNLPVKREGKHQIVND